MKHVLKYSPVNESMGRGSVLFVKGAPQGGRRRLFVTQILGYSEFKPGVVMFFLPRDFYQVEEMGGELVIKYVGLGDDSLRAVLNIKPNGAVTVVRNNAKTPWHWSSLKHTNISAALAELRTEILMGDYLLEEKGEPTDYEKVYNYLMKKVLETAILDRKAEDLVFTDFNVTNELTQQIDSASRSEYIEAEWEASFSCIYIGEEYSELLEQLDMGPIFDVSLVLQSEASVHVNFTRGDWNTPDYSETYIRSIHTKLKEAYIDGGSEEADPELRKIWDEANEVLSEMDARDLDVMLMQKALVPKHLKKGG